MVGKIGSQMFDYRFAYVFENTNVKLFLDVIKCRIIDCFKQEWFRSLDSPVLFMYKKLKPRLEYECNLDI